jgi:hypothetical protein
MCQFNNADEISLELNISDELLAQKNEKVGYAAAVCEEHAGRQSQPSPVYWGHKRASQ